MKMNEGIGCMDMIHQERGDVESISSCSRRAVLLAAGIGGMGLLTGCAWVKSFLPKPAKLEKPELSLVDIHYLKGPVWEQRFRVRLKVDNPNDIEVPISGITVRLELMNNTFATGTGSDFFTIPAKGAAEFDVQVTTGLLKTLKQVSTLLRSKEKSLAYRIAGQIQVELPYVGAVPFDKSGVWVRPEKWEL